MRSRHFSSLSLKIGICWVTAVVIVLTGTNAFGAGTPDGPGFLSQAYRSPLESTSNPAPPDNPVRLIFIHHSTGQNWLDDGNGELGFALRDNNYFVSDTNYGWGPGSIGDNTDIGHWWLWFRGPDSSGYLAALYGEGDQHSEYSRMDGDPPAGENEIILFKSCFPNSALQGNPSDPVPAIDDNNLRGEGSGSEYHTVANAKGIYIDILEYFRTRQDKLFIVIAAPPLRDATWSHNARAFNQWLINTWLQDYPYKNVAVFDFYNVLTTNGGNANVNDLNQESGNHHRWWNSAIQHKTDGDNDLNPDISEYPAGDDHPSRAGNLKATGEFLPLLNIFYHRWKDASQPSLVANFAAQGLWQYRYAAWSQLSGVSPNRMAGYGNKLVANFADYGLYQYDGAIWTQLTPYSNVENLVGVNNMIHVDFGSLGLWRYDGAWTNLSSANPEKMADNGTKLLATFSGYGLCEHDGTTWTQLTSTDAVDNMLAISGKVYVDFGTLGLWKYDGEWVNLSSVDPNKIQAYNGKLVANFPGFGLYEHDGASWTRLTANDSVENLIGVGGNLYADFGLLGLYRYNGTWTQISSADPDRLGSYGAKLVANFPIYGLYEYDGLTWTLLTGNAGATDMIGVDVLP